MAAENKTYRIGGLAITGTEAFLESFEPTFSAYLNQTVGEVYPGVGFIAVPLAFDDVWDAVSSASVDFLFLNPGSASCMESEFGVSAILSLRNFRQGNELNLFGGVVITAANRSDITEVAHLQDKVVEGVSVSGLGAFQLQWGLLQDQGFNLMADTEEVRFAYNQKKIVYDVINENVDVGFVRTDMVERMDAADLVPEWPLQALSHVPSDLAKEVVGALLLINETHEAAVSGGYSTWDVPLSYADLRR
ncbi:diguanylate cyclase/phosphodiesterase with PAS/PAC sensor(s) [Ectocarpus siliculosus]|uniref:Diguanylate cyclase/phosphodiesterase with PAS/PAC sensor(S) n=1 Tax=Ectocarpus siliculosus TaxID=2880 RepID=D7G0Y8_ECTSI|nr:diguanylate cyclase/phosphodiesterase with PAS/PAC sensor(s) [Ectocarpus siliculosus]|eukprot:CBJ26732.1 diguanylate cyclase/phosphodiesterase with PAS/PAC sensor(s) [Ectocarpus siliculosus]